MLSERKSRELLDFNCTKYLEKKNLEVFKMNAFNRKQKPV